MAELKRDRVNRQYPSGGTDGAVILPINCSVPPGTEVTLKRVHEREINCAIRDANAMYDPHIGDSIGDAVFDAMAPGAQSNIADAGAVQVVNAIGDPGSNMVLGFIQGNTAIVLGTRIYL